MRFFIKYFVIFLLISFQSLAIDKYFPNSGDEELDRSLISIEKEKQK